MLTRYFLLIIVIVIQGIPYLIKKKPVFAKLFLTLSFGELWLLATLRAPTFITDDLGYLEMFYSPALCYVEWGYCQLNNFIRLFGTEQYILFGVLALLIFIGVAIFIYRYSSNVVWSVLVYVCLMYAFNSLNGVRQFLVLSLVFLAFPLIQKRQFVKFLIVVLLACFFHKSAIVLLLFYWLYKVKVNSKNISILILGTILIFAAFSYLGDLYTLLGGSYAHYITTEVEQNHLATIIRFAVNLSIAIFCLLSFRQKDTSSDAKYPIQIPLSFLTLCACISVSGALISFQSYNVERIVYYFYLLNIITIPNILKTISNKSLRTFITIIVMLCLFTYGAIVIWSWQNEGIVYQFYKR